MRWARRVLAGVLSAALLPLCAAAQGKPAEAAAPSEGGMSAFGRDGYDAYIGRYADAPRPVTVVPVPAAACEGTPAPEVLPVFEGRTDVVVFDQAETTLTWKVTVGTAGLYRVAVDYYPAPGRTGNVEFDVQLNGERPFEQAQQIVLNRLWKDEAPMKQDNRGNDLRPTQVCEDAWLTADFADKEGILNQPYEFYLREGTNTLSLGLIREGVYLAGLRVYNPEPLPDYAAYRRALGGVKQPAAYQQKVQGEDAAYKSDPSLFPIADRSSPLTEPFDAAASRLNTIGGSNWQNAGQWISWEIEVPEDGDYILGMRYRQDLLKGFSSYRRVYIDDEVPFSELLEVEYAYDKDWIGEPFGGAENPYLFRLSKGRHTIRLEVVTGDTSQTIQAADNVVLAMNQVYRKIIMLTGVHPDVNRDYNLEDDIPELASDFAAIAKMVRDEVERVEKQSGRSNADIGLLKEIGVQLDSLAEDPESVVERLERYKNNVTALSAAILTMRQKPLEVDYLLAASPGTVMPRAKASFWESLAAGEKMFVASFFVDYNFIGDVAEGATVLDVWVMSGRDQAQVTKTLIDNQFTPKTGIAVNLNHVKGTLMEATMAGKGPDIALGVGRTQPVDLALRGTLLALEGFDGFEEAKKDFQETAFVPYTLQGHVYAMPETQIFDMLFYRTDIFEEIGVEPPETWDDLYRVIRLLERRNLDVGLPSLTTQTASSSTPFPKTFGSMLLQNGLSYFNDGQTGTRFDEVKAIEVFTQYIELYRDYSLPVYYDFATRFRSGEMPMGLAPYSMFNVLYIMAPEIRNLWEMRPVFGVRQEDGSVNNRVEGDGSGAIAFSHVKNPEDAFTFLRWWTGEEAQTLYAREMESILGPAARHTTANRRAFENLAWSASEQKHLVSQWDKVVEQPVIPGAYFMSRSLNNAVMEAVYDNGNPRAVLQKYNKDINQEIQRKRKEFKLDAEEGRS